MADMEIARHIGGRHGDAGRPAHPFAAPAPARKAPEPSIGRKAGLDLAGMESFVEHGHCLNISFAEKGRSGPIVKGKEDAPSWIILPRKRVEGWKGKLRPAGPFGGGAADLFCYAASMRLGRLASIQSRITGSDCP